MFAVRDGTFGGMVSVAQFGTIVDIFKHSVSTFPTRPLFGMKKDGTWRWTTYAEFGESSTVPAAVSRRSAWARGTRSP